MINLLPPDTKAQISAARANTALIRYNFIALGGLVFMLVAVIIVYVYLINAKAAAEADITYNKAQVSDYSSVESEASTFRQNLNSARQILDNDVTYTKVVLEIANLLPSGIILDTLSLDSNTFGTPTTLTARARDYQAALQLKDSLQHSDLFTNVSIQSISGGTENAYPLTVSLSVTIRKDAAR